MSSSIESSRGPKLLNPSACSLPDEEWLKTLSFRTSVSSELKSTAASGEVQQFTKLLKKQGGPVASHPKSVRKKLVARLAVLHDSTCVSDELRTALIESDLKKAERSVRVEAFIAEQTDAEPEVQTLCLALWMLTIYREKLSSETFFSLWRWTLQHGQDWIENRPVCDPEQGMSHLRSLELCLLMAATFPELQGSRSLQKETIRLIRNCVDESTDTDGTPHAVWVPGLLDSLEILARLTLFANTAQIKIWNKEYQARIEGLLNRAASFCSGGHISFAAQNHRLDYEKLTILAELLAEEGSAIVDLWESASKQKSLSSKKVSRWALPDEVHQSDWAMVACMRSGWSTPVDQCVVLFDSSIPKIDLSVEETPLFLGAWSQELIIDGRLVETKEDWSCSCWFADGEVNFLELVQEIDKSTKVVRQLIFLREQQALLLNHIVHASHAENIEFQASLPFNGHWELEQDTATREFALQSHTDEKSSSKRVRLYPLSLEQDRVQKAAGQIVADDRKLTIEQTATGAKLFVSTMLDWSSQRMHKATDWSRPTVAQDGKIETGDAAVALRCRVGREQWLFYHSLTEPDIPRTVMGLHTPHETVFSRFTSKGEIEPIIEVEM